MFLFLAITWVDFLLGVGNGQVLLNLEKLKKSLQLLTLSIRNKELLFVLWGVFLVNLCVTSYNSHDPTLHVILSFCLGWCFNYYLDMFNKLRSIYILPWLNLNFWFIITIWSISVTEEEIHLNWLNWFLILILVGNLVIVGIRLHDFHATIFWYCKAVDANCFFFGKARL